jgi:hypothetical protein
VALDFVVTGQSEWRRRSRMMAALAPPLHDRRDVAVEGWRWLKFAGRGWRYLAAVSGGLVYRNRLTG